MGKRIEFCVFPVEENDRNKIVQSLKDKGEEGWEIATTIHQPNTPPLIVFQREISNNDPAETRKSHTSEEPSSGSAPAGKKNGKSSQPSS